MCAMWIAFAVTFSSIVTTLILSACMLAKREDTLRGYNDDEG